MSESGSRDQNPFESPQTDSDTRQPKASLTRFVVLTGLCLAASISYVHRNLISVAATTIRDDLGLSDDQMGWLLSAFFIPYALVQIPSGWLGDRLGSRRALTIFSAAWSLFTGATAIAQGFLGIFCLRLGSGAAQAGIFPASTGTVSRWFPVSAQARSNGALGAFMSVGGALGAASIGYVVTAIGWRQTFFWYSIPGLIWAAWFYWWFRDRPDDHPSVNAAELALIKKGKSPEADAAEKETPSTPWALLLSSPAMFWICGQQFFRAAGYMFYASWFPAYLEETRGVSTEQAGLLTSLPLLATVLGSLSGGAVSDAIYQRTGSRALSRQAVAATGMFACSGLVFLAFGIANPMLAVGVITAGTFCAAVAGPCAYTITIDMGGRHVATVFSTMNMSGNIGAVLFPLIVPKVVSYSGWNSVLILSAGIYMGAGLCWLFFNAQGDVFSQSWLKRRERSSEQSHD